MEQRQQWLHNLQQDGVHTQLSSSNAELAPDQLSRFQYQWPTNSLNLDCCYTICQGHCLTFKPITIRLPQLVFVTSAISLPQPQEDVPLGSAFHDFTHCSYLLCLRSATFIVGYINHYRYKRHPRQPALGTNY